ncbi:MAG: translation initiation factor IF-1 [Bdellovibrio sp.]|nr:translation initiation factor IF-1 [Bdellovibrio sp.]
MSKEDNVPFDGQIIAINGGGSYAVKLDQGSNISAKLCGKMKKFKIRIVIGDRVTVAISPYDVTHGLITFRFKA